MAAFNNEIIAILATDVFKAITNAKVIQITQLNAAISLLIKANIAFDILFRPGTTRENPVAELIIFINPTTTLEFAFVFDEGGSVLGGLP